MPYSRGGMYGDKAEFANWWDIPMETRLAHSWVFVDDDATRLLTDHRLQSFERVEKVRSNLLKDAVLSPEKQSDVVRDVDAVYKAFCERYPLMKYNGLGKTTIHTYADRVKIQCEVRPRICPMGCTHDVPPPVEK